MKKLILGFGIWLLASSLSTQAQVLEDKVFVDHVFSARIFPEDGQISSTIDAPVVSLQDSKRLV
ncbi:MAG: hypothetical protein B7Z16_07930, partial [Algoriphagus sp. 32-45-6]